MLKQTISITLALTLSVACGTAPDQVRMSAKAGSGEANPYGGKDKDSDAPVVTKPTTTDSSSKPTTNSGDSTAGNTNSGTSTDGKAPDTTKPNTSTTDGATTTIPTGSCTSVNLETAKRPEDFACLGSVDAIFKNIPTWLNKHYTLFHSSKSAQKATMENPRIIVASPEGSFIFATSTDPNAKKEVEIAVYDYEKEKWQFAGLDWSSGTVKVETELCQSCHGGEEVARTNWGSYGQWTGAYGNGGDHGMTAEQGAMARKFKAKEAGTPDLMKYLDFSRVSATGLRWAGPGEVEANESIGIMMAVKAGRSYADKIIKKGSKAQVRDAILETICSGSSSSQTLKDMGLPTSVHLQTAPDAGEGKNFRSVNVGYQSNVWMAGLILIQKALIADPGLAAAAPEAVTFMKKKGVNLMMSNGVKDFFAKGGKNGGHTITFRGETQSGAEFSKSGAICTSIRNYNP